MPGLRRDGPFDLEVNHTILVIGKPVTESDISLPLLEVGVISITGVVRVNKAEFAKCWRLTGCDDDGIPGSCLGRDGVEYLLCERKDLRDSDFRFGSVVYFDFDACLFGGGIDG